MKFPIKDCSSKCEIIRSFQRIWLHLLEKSFMENFIFCVVWLPKMYKICFLLLTRVNHHLATNLLLGKKARQLICSANQLGDFCVMKTLVANGLRIYQITSLGLSHYIFWIESVIIYRQCMRKVMKFSSSKKTIKHIFFQ